VFVALEVCCYHEEEGDEGKIMLLEFAGVVLIVDRLLCMTLGKTRWSRSRNAATLLCRKHSH
jgi:hypothetical protein